jgi:putative component of membrane protein insertase Oxa1/YidC/SpoIIIJ protein YidD
MKGWNGSIFLLVVASLFFCKICYGQPVIDAELRTLFNKSEHVHPDYSRQLKVADNELELSLASAFFIYKTFVSSQDQPSCVFTPSCSEYAMDAFNKKGLFLGWIYTFDRLSRCHGFVNPANYSFNRNVNRFYDPVK